jgi:hypothetical protein
LTRRLEKRPTFLCQASGGSNPKTVERITPLAYPLPGGLAFEWKKAIIARKIMDGCDPTKVDAKRNDHPPEFFFPW